jgi:hypothetical protein
LRKKEQKEHKDVFIQLMELLEEKKAIAEIFD